ncbi:MAG: invasion associated locus B family protein [Alphaproteobacteria bacterium]|nr:invasion associated locus B family protein [Alphaproteobacteria bacterium]
MTDTQTGLSGTITLRRLPAALAVAVALIAAGSIGFYLRGLDYFAGPKAGERLASSPHPVATVPSGFTRLPSRTFGNWTMTCIEAPKQGKRCELVMPVVDKNKQAVLRLAVTRGPQGKAVLVVMTPPNVVLPEGLTLVPGRRSAIKLGFLRCAPRACQAITALDSGAESALSAADTLEIGYVGAGGRKVAYKMPTSGFADGYAAWQAAYPPPASPSAP